MTDPGRSPRFGGSDDSEGSSGLDARSGDRAGGRPAEASADRAETSDRGPLRTDGGTESRPDGGVQSRSRFEDIDWEAADAASAYDYAFGAVVRLSAAVAGLLLFGVVYTFALVPLGVPEIGLFGPLDWSSKPTPQLLVLGMALFTLVGSAVRNRELFATIVAIDLAVLYDYFLLGRGQPTLKAGPLVWDLTGVDWLLVITLSLLVVYGVVPAYRNPRRTRYYWRRFRRNRAAVVSLLFLVLIFGAGLVVPLFAAPPQADPSVSKQPPMFMSTPLSTVGGQPENCVGKTVVTSKTQVGGTTIAEGRCFGSAKYPLGTTSSGKGILVSVVYGMRISLEVGLIPTVFLIVIGMSVGAVAAYAGAGSLLDEILMRYVDIQQVFPVFFLYLLIFYIFGIGLFEMILIFGLLQWGGTARLVRSAALQLREEEYIQASRGVGAEGGHVIRQHMVPNVANIVVTNASLLVPSFILTEAGLAFLGLGDPTVPSWGQLIASGRAELTDAWWIATIPGVFLFLTVMALNMVGDAFTDALDPQQDSGGE